jgi:septum site-determining protein MinD
MKIIVFHSYKGGTGKTTIAINTAINFARKGYKTLAIDADLKAPTFDSIFPGLEPAYRFNELFEKRERPKGMKDPKPLDLPVKSKVHDNLDLIFADPKPKFGEGLLSMDKNFHTKALKKLADSKAEFEAAGYDFVIIDTSPSLNLPSVNALFIADAAILVLRPNQYGITGTNFLLKELYSMLGNINRKDYILFNQVVPGTANHLVNKWKRDFKRKLNVDTIGVIPCNCQIALSMLNGNMLFDKQENAVFQKVMDQIFVNLMKELT